VVLACPENPNHRTVRVMLSIQGIGVQTATTLMAEASSGKLGTVTGEHCASFGSYPEMTVRALLNASRLRRINIVFGVIATGQNVEYAFSGIFTGTLGPDHFLRILSMAFPLANSSTSLSR
jgi:hypothetical protein